MDRKKLFLIFFCALLLISFPNYTINVKGIVIGDYYVAIFDDYADGKKYINETVAGDKWLEIVIALVPVCLGIAAIDKPRIEG